MTYTKDTLKEAIIQKLRLNYGCTEKQATDGEIMKACAMVLRDIMAEHGVQTREKAAHEGQRKVHYLSMEFLMGRSLMKNAYNLELLDDLTAAIDELPAFFAGLGMPTKLGEFGLKPENVDAFLITLKANKGEEFGGFKKINLEDARKIYCSAF